jgi:3-phenylpropionate/trans-cinnamate dioxygenase ferredoxin subunit
VTFTEAAILSELPDNVAVAVEVEGVEVALIRAGDEVFAIRDECSHASVALSEGDVTFDDAGTPEIECWLHGSTFNLRTGHPVILPATEPVPVYPVTIDGDAVLIDVENPQNSAPQKES